MDSEEETFEYDPETQICRNITIEIASNILEEDEQDNEKLRKGGY